MSDLADTILRGGRRRLPLFGEAEEPALVGLPAPIAASQGVRLPERDELSERAFALLSAVKEAALAPRERETAVFSLEDLDAQDRSDLWEMLGEGEVSIVVQGASRYEIQETALPGIFRVRTHRGEGVPDALHLEVGAVPAVVVAAALHGTSPELPLEDPPPTNLMNAQPLLAELRHRMATHAPTDPNHVVSLSLLPLSDADTAYLARALGAGPIKAESRGYGNCRVSATARRGIWAVQYFNVMDTLILDTLEIGSVPEAIIAATMDLEDSGARLAELLDYVRPAS
jgi:hydrogenase-1 operon protein HyaF